MTPEIVTELGRQALETTLLVSSPILGLSLFIGLTVSAIQAMTQLNEATLTFVPKVVGLFVALLLFLPWMLNVMTTYMANLLMNIPNYVRQQDVEKVLQLRSRIAQRLNVRQKVRFVSSLAAALLEGLFEHPAGYVDSIYDI